ncbi:MAG: hypothetical protein UY61_C0061G0003 [Candidatus Adlerbacteria bacterium GW2011_GWC1_50_9]|uniref:Uncharacterized protein n=1 Tax=Candidatus Adlerbacteria bacterium GW2011_GWC1_50_9 TaxID=1618608 RepID=A0A0G1WKV4_9BACT|nr:MAG: hypothetical protein UY61_C0061G0003 [Candidatus Adlerbacteria bacterium GW2011_GWC1_50_9]
MLRIVRADYHEVFFHVGDTVEPNVMPSNARVHAEISKYFCHTQLQGRRVATETKFLVRITLSVHMSA